ncbi:helix-turn-helix domain-containing protein [Microvirga makkahensis]|uniref:Helix-turn-helix domain-containing protein n=1 Tax=Microvirga makkahensis TaxID=1128670 RepID=A0A7X3MNU3_9HYPH|nr:helix-turn-helix domain-containing protein [Microvirga makkahensis]MXQ10432.1 helix-turn-helix domain-containing protein [Microvirga makkahensis]
MPSSQFFRFDGSSVSSAEEAYWIWRDIVSVLFDVSLADAKAVDSFRVGVESYHLGPLLIGSAESAAQQFRRSPTTIARSGVDHYVVQLYQQGGYVGEAEGRTVRVEPGDISILDLSRTLQTQAESFRNLTLVVPRPLLEPLLKNPDGLHGMVLPGRSALGHLLSNYLRTVYETAGSLSAEDSAALTAATASLIAGCFGPSADAQEPVMAARRGALLLAVKRYIDGNLADPDLTVDHLAREFRLSRATLARLFETLGGVAGYIRERRLLRCLAEITAPDHAHRSIGELAYVWGFGNEAAFSRAFRRMFGISPREARAEASLARRAAQQRLSGLPDDGGPVLAQWIRNLKG